MRIALLSFEYPPETGFGGIGTYTWHQARALAKLGHEVHVLAGAREATVTLDEAGTAMSCSETDAIVQEATARS